MQSPILSIIIVSYNVRYFLQQCLHSVRRASEGRAHEIIVVDNHSADDSVDMIRACFPEAILIANQDNPGFSKANNQAIRMARGKYILLLNPDTVVEEDTFEKCISFMESHREAGALGVRMIDGQGHFLPESKRALPRPDVAFYKMFGLASLFPQSRRFGKYHQLYLNEFEVNETEVLSGAFFFCRAEALLKAGLLDEDYFMYGEDIDLSYKISQAGYKVYYFPDTSIIHYKGESTKKGSLNYVIVFYRAMAIFAQKHFARSQAGAFNLLINIAIILRGALAWFGSLASSNFLWIMDFSLSYSLFLYMAVYWEREIKFLPHYFPDKYLFFVIPIYIMIWMLSGLLSGAYRRPFRLRSLLSGIAAGTLAIAVTYAFLPESWRFSRALILLGAMLTFFSMGLLRLFYNIGRHRSYRAAEQTVSRYLLIGGPEMKSAESIIRKYQLNAYVSFLLPEDAPAFLSGLSSSEKMAEGKTCVVFSADALSYQTMIANFNKYAGLFSFKIFQSDSAFLVGSDSRDAAGEVMGEHLLSFPSAAFRQEKAAGNIWGFWALLGMALPALMISPLRFFTLLTALPDVLRGKRNWSGPISASSGLPSVIPYESEYAPSEDVLKWYAATYSAFGEPIAIFRYLFRK